MLERLLLTGVCVMVFTFNHSISSVQSWLDLNLPREHVPYFFTNNPHIRSWCLEDSACPYKVELRLLKNTIIMSKYVFIFRITTKFSPMNVSVLIFRCKMEALFFINVTKVTQIQNDLQLQNHFQTILITYYHEIIWLVEKV